VHFYVLKIKLLKTFKLFFDVTWQTHQYLGVKQTALSIIKNRDINFCFIHFYKRCFIVRCKLLYWLQFYVDNPITCISKQATEQS